MIKCFETNYSNTILRKIYVLVSTLMLFSFLIFAILSYFNKSEYVDFLWLLWIIFTPVLITISLIISYLDTKFKTFNF